MVDLLFVGVGWTDLALTLNRIAVGAFFMLSGYHKLFNGQRIKLYKPIDEADRIDDWLYLPETLYTFMLIIVVSAGAGPYSLDSLIVGLMNKHVA
jgi:uncharacterized membrane protein YphA (DoxX/SURF4 family)